MIQEKIDENNVLVHMEAIDKKEVIQKLAELLEKNGFISNLDTFIQDVFDREDHMTTGIGNNIAIPHGKSSAVIDSTVAVVKLKNPVEWNSLDGNPVNIVFLLAIKDSDKGDAHLRVLAELSGKLMDDAFVKGIKEASTQNKLYKALAF